MKKYGKCLAAVVVLVMAVSGCAAVNSFLSSAPIEFFCNPTAEQQATATAMLTALDTAQAAGAIFYPVIGIAQASAVLKVIQGGGCFVVAQLKEAFAAVDAANAATAQAQLKKMPDMAPPTLPEYPALRKLVK